MSRPCITTIEELVDALGGPSAVADWLGISQPAVSNWITRNYIAPGWHGRLIVECLRLGLRVDWCRVLSMPEEDAAVLDRVMQRRDWGRVQPAVE